jgi:hypothetical protein
MILTHRGGTRRRPGFWRPRPGARSALRCDITALEALRSAADGPDTVMVSGRVLLRIDYVLTCWMLGVPGGRMPNLRSLLPPFDSGRSRHFWQRLVSFATLR